MDSFTFTVVNEAIHLPIINGYVKVPDLPINKRLTLANALAAIPNSSFKFIVDQYMYIFPIFDRSLLYPEDWFAILRAAAGQE